MKLYCMVIGDLEHELKQKRHVLQEHVSGIGRKKLLIPLR